MTLIGSLAIVVVTQIRGWPPTPKELSFLADMQPKVDRKVEGRKSHPIADVWILIFKKRQRAEVMLRLDLVYGNAPGWDHRITSRDSGMFSYKHGTQVIEIVAYAFDRGFITGTDAFLVTLSKQRGVSH